MKNKLQRIDKKNLRVIGVLILILVLPLILSALYFIQDTRSRAALPDQLETESGVLSSSGVTKQSDSGASGGQFVRFSKYQTNPTPTSPPNQGGYGPRPDPPFPTGSNVVTIDSTVSTTDSDAGPELQAFIDRQPDGTTIIFDKTKGGSGSTYTMTNGIRLNCRNNLTFWGYNSKLKVTRTDGDGQGQGITLRDGSENISILGFEIEGPNKPADLRNLYNYLPGESSHGVGIYASRNIRVEDNIIHNTNGDGIYITGFSNVEPRCNKNWNTIGPFYFQYNHIYQVNRQGIVNNDGVGIYIRHNLIEDIGMYPIDAEDGTSMDPPRKMDQVYITDNLLRRWSWYDLFVPRAISNIFKIGQHSSVNYYEISRNVIEEGPMNPRNGAQCDWVFEHNNNHVLTEQMVINDNVFKLDPEHSTQCPRSNPDHGSIIINNAKNLTIKNNDFQGMRILHTGTFNADITGNGNSPITTSYYDPY